MKKAFDCIEMKRKVQEQVYEETRSLSRDEELEYFRQAGENFWRGIATLRRSPRRQSAQTKRAAAGSRHSG